MIGVRRALLFATALATALVLCAPLPVPSARAFAWRSAPLSPAQGDGGRVRLGAGWLQLLISLTKERQRLKDAPPPPPLHLQIGCVVSSVLRSPFSFGWDAIIQLIAYKREVRAKRGSGEGWFLAAEAAEDDEESDHAPADELDVLLRTGHAQPSAQQAEGSPVGQQPPAWAPWAKWPQQARSEQRPLPRWAQRVLRQRRPEVLSTPPALTSEPDWAAHAGCARLLQQQRSACASEVAALRKTHRSESNALRAGAKAHETAMASSELQLRASYIEVKQCRAELSRIAAASEGALFSREAELAKVSRELVALRSDLVSARSDLTGAKSDLTKAQAKAASSARAAKHASTARERAEARAVERTEEVEAARKRASHNEAEAKGARARAHAAEAEAASARKEANVARKGAEAARKEAVALGERAAAQGAKAVARAEAGDSAVRAAAESVAVANAALAAATQRASEHDKAAAAAEATAVVAERAQAVAEANAARDAVRATAAEAAAATAQAEAEARVGRQHALAKLIACVVATLVAGWLGARALALAHRKSRDAEVEAKAAEEQALDREATTAALAAATRGAASATLAAALNAHLAHTRQKALVRARNDAAAARAHAEASGARAAKAEAVARAESANAHSLINAAAVARALLDVARSDAEAAAANAAAELAAARLLVGSTASLERGARGALERALAEAKAARAAANGAASELRAVRENAAEAVAAAARVAVVMVRAAAPAAEATAAGASSARLLGAAAVVGRCVARAQAAESRCALERLASSALNARLGRACALIKLQLQRARERAERVCVALERARLGDGSATDDAEWEALEAGYGRSARSSATSQAHSQGHSPYARGYARAFGQASPPLQEEPGSGAETDTDVGDGADVLEDLQTRAEQGMPAAYHQRAQIRRGTAVPLVAIAIVQAAEAERAALAAADVAARAGSGAGLDAGLPAEWAVEGAAILSTPNRSARASAELEVEVEVAGAAEAQRSAIRTHLTGHARNGPMEFEWDLSDALSLKLSASPGGGSRGDARRAISPPLVGPRRGAGVGVPHITVRGAHITVRGASGDSEADEQPSRAAGASPLWGSQNRSPARPRSPLSVPGATPPLSPLSRASSPLLLPPANILRSVTASVFSARGWAAAGGAAASVPEDSDYLAGELRFRANSGRGSRAVRIDGLSQLPALHGLPCSTSLDEVETDSYSTYGSPRSWIRRGTAQPNGRGVADAAVAVDAHARRAAVATSEAVLVNPGAGRGRRTPLPLQRQQTAEPVEFGQMLGQMLTSLAPRRPSDNGEGPSISPSNTSLIALAVEKEERGEEEEEEEEEGRLVLDNDTVRDPTAAELAADPEGALAWLAGEARGLLLALSTAEAHTLVPRRRAGGRRANGEGEAVAAAETAEMRAEVERLRTALAEAFARATISSPDSLRKSVGGWGTGGTVAGAPAGEEAPRSVRERRMSQKLDRQDRLKQGALVRIQNQAHQIELLRQQLREAGLQPVAAAPAAAYDLSRADSMTSVAGGMVDALERPSELSVSGSWLGGSGSWLGSDGEDNALAGPPACVTPPVLLGGLGD
ncbi:hypothetical protein T492DRAFT_841864 [Pavlovales sp. CCMP2436]|nr:hypothetical protein T492DRAFT_841864 [Pavlovales sp. CCMP2436]